jgi:predicted 2-oxoglutarate/Fe(II)-dependent dioxygenase YbiX/peroxiredoxin
VLEIGDRIPDLGLPDPRGVLFSLKDQKLAGRPLAVLIFAGEIRPPVARELRRFAEAAPQYETAGFAIAAVGGSVTGNAAFTGETALPYPFLADPTGVVTAALAGPALQRARSGCAVALVDAASRYLGQVEVLGEAKLSALAFKKLERMTAAATAPVVTAAAPVLLVPNVLEPETCQEMIAAWEAGERFEGGVSGSNQQAALAVNYGYKKRDDWILPAGPLLDRLKQRLLTRLFPAMADAYYWAPTRHEAFRIGCYAEGGGFFRLHRDNRTPHTAHRRYALTLLLNDDFEGGFLRFPEFGPALYKPPVGGAVVFSCNLLHEVTDVSRGRRFALVSFFYGEAEAQALRERAQR